MGGCVSARGAELGDRAGWDSPNVIGSLPLEDERRDLLITALRQRARDAIGLTRGFFPPLWHAEHLYLNHFSRAEVTWRATDIEVTAGDERLQFECEGPEFAGGGMSFGPSWACVVNLRARLGGAIAECSRPQPATSRAISTRCAADRSRPAPMESSSVARALAISSSGYFRTARRLSTPGSARKAGFAQGAYTVALTLHFFSDFGSLSGRRTWTAGMDPIAGDESLEIDFGVFLGQNGWRKSARVAVLLGEAKTFGRFERKDLCRGAKLLDRFDHSVFVMATRDALDDDERDAIPRMALARRTRSGWPTRRGRIVVLTANELAVRGGVGVRDTWIDLGGRHAKLAASFQELDSDIGQLSEATLGVYADLAWPDPRR